MTLDSTRAIAFDLFHTLVDPEEFRPPEFRRSRAIAQFLGLPVEQFVAAWEAEGAERQLSVIPTVLERIEGHCDDFGISPPAEVWPEVADLWGRFTDMAILNPRWNVVQALEELKSRGWILGLLSNCDELEKRKWSESALAPLFDATVFSCEIGFAKPSVEAYRALIPRWGGVPLEQAVFVGDGANEELDGARRAGFTRVVFQSGFVSVNGLRPAAANDRLRQQADATVSGVAEVLSLVPNHPGPGPEAR